MTTNTPLGAKPRKDAPKKIAVGGIAHTTTIKFFAATIIAIHARLTRAVSGFYLYLGIGLDALVMLALAAVYVIWEVFA